MRRRNNEEILEKLNKRKEFLRNEIEKIQEIENDLSSSLWKYVEDKFLAEYNEISNKLDNFEKLNDRDILIELSKRKQVKNILSVRNYIEMKDKLNEELREISERIEEYSN